MKKRILIITGIVILLFTNILIMNKEYTLRKGNIIYLKLRPVDPRSLMQGDYMALRFEIDQYKSPQGRVKITLDEQSVGHVSHSNEDMTITVNTDAFFFQEGTGSQYSGAQYGEFRVNRSGETILIGLRDRDLQTMGYVAE